MDIPISPYYADKHYMHYQIQHGKPIVGGHISRRPRALLDFLEGSIFTHDMLHHRVMDPAVRDVSRQLGYLAAANVRYLVINKRFATAEQVAAWQAWLLVPPRYEDESVAVYATTLEAGRDFMVTKQPLEALGIFHASTTLPTVQQGYWVTVNIGWTARATVAQDYTACIQMINPQRVVSAENCAPISPDWPTSRWTAGEVVRDHHRFQVNPHLPAADYTLALVMADGANQRIGQPTTIGSLTVTALPRTFVAPSPQERTNLRLGETIALLGYDVRVAEAVTKTIRLTLYWQVRQPITQSYKVFVHLVDPATNTILAQSDAAPRQWRYPTTWWQAREVVAELIELPIDLATTAAPFLRIGLYDEATGARLRILDQAGATVPDDAFTIMMIAQTPAHGVTPRPPLQ